jgi:hypothetical protein
MACRRGRRNTDVRAIVGETASSCGRRRRAMTGAFERVFSPAVIERFARRLDSVSPALRERYDAVTASGPYPSEASRARRLRIWRARRAAWEAYLDAADATGLLDEDLVSRLTGEHEPGFRSAIAEAMACWVLAGKLGLKVQPRPPGRKLHRLDLAAEGTVGTFHVEVKAPAEVPIPESGVWNGDDSAVLVDCLRQANEQFAEGVANVLVVVPQFRTPVVNDRNQLIRAFIGEPAITWAVNMKTGAAVGETETVFLPRGHLVRSRGRAADGTKEKRPAFTRVSAVMTIEPVLADRASKRSRFTPEQLEEAGARGDRRMLGEALWEALVVPTSPDNPTWVEHAVLVLHNPYAQRALDEAVFQSFPQLVLRGSEMIWTDGHVEE